MVVYERFELPEPVSAAALNLRLEVDAAGYSGAILMVRDGFITYLDLEREEGVQHFLKLINSEWYEIHEIGGDDGLHEGV